MINRMQKWIYVIILLTGYSIRSYTQKTINLNIPVEQNWMFDNEHPVRFMLELTSAQSGFRIGYAWTLQQISAMLYRLPL